MIGKDIIDIIRSFVVYVILQLFFVNKLVLFDQTFCFFYVGFLLFLPQNLGKIYQLILGFAIGLLVDVFFDTIGIHAAASVLLMFLRPSWINFTTGGSLEDGEKINIRNLGLTTFVTYIIPMIIIHHLAIFSIEGYGFSGFWAILVKSLTSSIFTAVVLLTIHLILLPTKRRI